jgi:putative peptidoglycan lipid II flippase
MVPLGWPAIDLVFTGGRFSADDARLCSAYFAVFSVSLFLWSAQAIYSRAFYAAGNTFVPMVASTIVTVVSLPIYDLLFHWRGAIGLALASDIGIALQTLTIALLLHKRRMVSLASLDYAEMGRCLLGSCVGGAGAGLVAWALAALFHHTPRMAQLHHGRSIADAAILFAGSAVWIVMTMFVLDKSGSALPRATMRRMRLS